jgi:hypothetical protein
VEQSGLADSWIRDCRANEGFFHLLRFLNYQETERAGFVSQSGILREEDPLSLLPGALSAINETCLCKRSLEQAGSRMALT